MKKTLEDLFENISVLPVDGDLGTDDLEGRCANLLDGWYAISTEKSGGIIAYFRDEENAFSFRLSLINSILNKLKE